MRRHPLGVIFRKNRRTYLEATNTCSLCSLQVQYYYCLSKATARLGFRSTRLLQVQNSHQHSAVWKHALPSEPKHLRVQPIKKRVSSILQLYTVAFGDGYDHKAAWAYLDRRVTSIELI
jgi:hypothetical protein